MSNQKKFRHELKYYITFFEYRLLRPKLNHVLKSDEFAGQAGDYHIRSLYFDDLHNSALYEKQAGVLTRQKFRIRVYNYSDDVIKLEKKSRIGQFINKESARLTTQQYQMIRSQDYGFLKESSNHLFNEFYFHLTANKLKPDVIVDYVREAYTSKLSNIRITFDKNRRTGLSSTDLFNESLPTVDVLERPVHILEIKYDNFLPTHIRNILQLSSNTRFAISKFVICKKFNKFNNWEDN